MSDMNLAIRVTKECQSRLGIGLGCVLTLVFASGGTAKAQVVQMPSENKGEVVSPQVQLVHASSGAFSSRRTLSQFPQADEPSPNDLTKDSDDKQSADKKVDEQSDVEDNKDKNESTPEAADKGITPVQSAGLRVGVDLVNITTQKIGTGLLPEDTAAMRAAPPTSLMDGQSRGIVTKHVNWRPASICHLPLYFEDAMLERHGHARWGCAQPIVSGAKFLSTIPLLPYIATLQPKCEPRYTLGHFRPGSCAPTLKDHLPWDSRAATVEVVSLGAFFWAAPL